MRLNFMKSMTGGAVALCLGAIAAFADPATLSADNPQAMADAMLKLGYRAQLTTDNTGDPLIRSGASGWKYGIYFYGCENGKDCTSIQFYMGIELDHTVSLERINDWNREKRFGTAVFDTDGFPYLRMDLNLEFGGITAPAFKDNLEMWDRLIADFSEMVTAENPTEDDGGIETAPKKGPSQDL